MSSLRNAWRAGVQVLPLIALLSYAVLWAQPTIQIKEYSVGAPFDITSGPDGAMWFTNLSSIGRITTSGIITTYPLPTKDRAAVRITAGPDGALWFTENSPDAIGRITIYGAITEYPLPNPASGVRGITSGPDGALWFTEWSGGNIGRITTTGIITEYPLPRFASTDWITAGPDGALWFTETNAAGGGGDIGRISSSGSITEYLLPPAIAGWAQWGFTGIATGPDGALWVTEWVGHRILRVATTGSVTTFDIPGCPMTPQAWICADGITKGPDGALWFTLFSANSIGRITTTGTITQYPIPTVNSQSSGIATGPDGSIWFTEHASGKIGQAVLSQPDTSPPLISGMPSPGCSLWPPDHKLVQIADVKASDALSGIAPGSFKVTGVSNEPSDPSNPDVVITPDGSGGFIVQLRADRLGSGNGRVYTLTATAMDNAGNSATVTSACTIPHDQGK